MEVAPVHAPATTAPDDRESGLVRTRMPDDLPGHGKQMRQMIAFAWSGQVGNEGDTCSRRHPGLTRLISTLPWVHSDVTDLAPAWKLKRSGAAIG
jgi:hypothetical protein